ncbi:MAG: T9SS type A sorting domain-containing protein [Calditrichia bacterium]|nr:T9SS type A sorting domain-containing protein [Calditrichia bacterium]
MISWTDNRDGDGGIYAQRYSSDGSAMGENFQVSNTGSSPDVNLWNGRIYTTWSDNRGDGGEDIWANVLDWNAVGIGDKDIPQIPSAYQLSQNYPNPFNPTTIINYELPIKSYVELSIYNMLGQKVATLVSEKKQAGYHEVEFYGGNLSSGIYLYRIEAGEWTDVRKMILLR